MFCFSLFLTPESKLRTPQPMRLRSLELSNDMMSPTAQWSWESRVFSDITYCSAQEYSTSSATNNEGGHGGK